jgi:hypothetical protein
MRSPTPNPKLIVTAEVAAYVKKKMNGNAVNSQSCKQTNTKKEAVCSIPFRTSVGIEDKAGWVHNLYDAALAINYVAIHSSSGGLGLNAQKWINHKSYSE